MSEHVVLEIALGIEPLAAILRARKWFLAPVDTHMNHIVLADAEYFFALRRGAPVWFRALVQMKMLVKAGFASENLLTAFVLALKFFIGLTFL